MAEALISTVLKDLNKFLLQGGVELMVGAADQLQKLSSSFTSIQALLNDADTRQLYDESVRHWLGKLKDVAYDLDDVLDEWRTLVLSSEVTASDGDCHGDGDGNGDGDGTITNKVHFCLSPSHFISNQTESNHSNECRIKEIWERLDVIVDEKNKYQFHEAEMVETNGYQKINPLVNKSLEIHGRNEDRDVLISKLMGDSNGGEKGIAVISVVGIGGIGKTALAQLIYNDERVKAHFVKRLWVSMSQDFSVKNLEKRIIQNDETTHFTIWELFSLQKYLHRILLEQNFLLILDGLWNHDEIECEKLARLISSGMHGSRILVTTRTEDVAVAMGTNYIHHLTALSDEDSWSLFSRRAFIGREREGCPEMENIGKEIVKKCQGVPLFVKIIGGVMERKRTVSDWQQILESEIWDIKGNKKGIIPALLLSYYNLPMHLKQCFAYCSLFPQDYVMEKNELVKLWMAQGFIRSERRREVEEIGQECFDDLLRYSLFQDAETDDSGNIISCKMQSLVHEFAQNASEGECCIVNLRKSDLSSFKSHHSSFILNYGMSSFPGELCNLNRLHTLLLLGRSSIQTIPHDLFEHAKFLKTLDLSGSELKELPNSIGELTHLRYLNLSELHYMANLPESVANLCNLQTLKLNGCFQLRKLPEGMSRLVSLRHFETEKTKLMHMPRGIGQLSLLQTLSTFIVWGQDGYKIGELKNLNYLSGNLEIRRLDRVTSGDEAKEANLRKKKHLQTLTLHCERREEHDWGTMEQSVVKKMDDVFEGLGPPHTNLKQLKIQNYMGSTFPSWMNKLSLFSKLVEVDLADCRKCRQLPNLGELPSLKYLNIWGNDEIEQVGNEFTGNQAVAFPKLEKLSFYGITKWEEWDMSVADGKIVMPNLVELNINSCYMLKKLPPLGKLPSLKFLVIVGNHGIERLGHEFCGNVVDGDGAKQVAFPSLEEIIFSMSSCEEWDLSMENGEIIMPTLFELSIECSRKLKTLPERLPTTLRKLTIEYCDQLTWRPSPHHPNLHLEELVLKGNCAVVLPSSLPCLPNLKKLVIWQAGSLPCDGWEQLNSLQTLEMQSSLQLESLPDGLKHLKSLLTLKISSFRQLNSLPSGLGQLESLHTLGIISCPRLRSLPNELGQLKSLHTLEIISCPQLRSLPNELGQLKSLQKLHIISCSKLNFLPDGLGQLESLNTLSISSCHMLKSLSVGLGQLKSLHTLRIHRCHRLKSLPQELKLLKALQELYISECQLLTRRIKKEGGVDWHKIAHIPNIKIDEVKLQWLQSDG